MNAALVVLFCCMRRLMLYVERYRLHIICKNPNPWGIVKVNYLDINYNKYNAKPGPQHCRVLPY